jgi:membrane protein required for colicin V production
MSTTFNFFDLIFLAFTLIFVILAFLRGFVKEVFSLFTWVLALVLSHVLAPYADSLLSSYSSNKLMLDIVVRTIIFIFVFLGIGISTSALCLELKEKMPKALDRSLGVLYGFFKTLLIFGLIYSAICNSYGYLLGKKDAHKKPKAELPSWLREAKSHNILKAAGEVLDPVVVLFINSMQKNMEKAVPDEKDLDEKIDEIIEQKDEKVPPSERSEKPEETKVDRDAGYNKKDIKKMDHLIEIIDKK